MYRFRHVSDIELHALIFDSEEFHGLRLLHQGLHNEEMIFKSGPFAEVPRGYLVNGIKAWLFTQRVIADDARIYQALRIVGLEKQRVYGALDRLGL